MGIASHVRDGTIAGDGRWRWTQWQEPQICSRVARSLKDDLIVVIDTTMGAGEPDITPIVAKFGNGYEGVGS
jgi:hypothetical protein